MTIFPPFPCDPCCGIKYPIVFLKSIPCIVVIKITKKIFGATSPATRTMLFSSPKHQKQNIAKGKCGAVRIGVVRCIGRPT